MSSPIIEVEIEVFCNCGEHLCDQSSFGGRNKKGYQLTVTPCQKCLDKAREDGKQEGIEEEVGKHEQD